MKYLLFEQSAVEAIINDTALQSSEFPTSKCFIDCIRNGSTNWHLDGVAYKVEKDGIVFCGKSALKTFLLFDLEHCKLLEKANDADLLIVIQKTFRFAVRYWNRQAFTNCEKNFKNQTVVFPFPFSVATAYRIVIERNLSDKRLDPRGIKNSLLAYRYGTEAATPGAEDAPDLTNFRKGGEQFLSCQQELRTSANAEPVVSTSDQGREEIVHVIQSGNIVSQKDFKFLNYEKQLNNLTDSQKTIVNCADISSPIRVEGPAGTGKTAALILRTIKLLQDAEKENREMLVQFFTHSKSTEDAVKQLFMGLAKEQWLDGTAKQHLEIQTLQDFCLQYVQIVETKIIDLDASEAKQYQLLLIQDAYSATKGEVFNTFKPLLSPETTAFFEKEEENKIILMLQYEFSIRIKGMAEASIDRYKKLEPLQNGIPLMNENDSEFIYHIFTKYQSFLESQSVYDTDDVILEALARLNAPLWRRARVKDGADYLIVDEMHLFNLNEQQVFHCLTKDGDQKKIPICFALDYGQVIGERGDMGSNYIEQNLAVGEAMHQEFGTVFRSSQQIAELCASITTSGALMFNAFVNPYKYCESSFTANEEALCDTPKLIMYANDEILRQSLEGHIKAMVNKYKCAAGEIALVFFDDEMLSAHFTQNVGKYQVNYINGRHSNTCDSKSAKVVCTLPEYINGLEFKCVILVGVDEGRVPQKGIHDISSNFLKYSALNKLYLACSRAQYCVQILGTESRGVSSCLQHSLSNGTLTLENPVHK